MQLRCNELFLFTDEREDVQITPKSYGDDNRLIFNNKASLGPQNEIIPKKYLATDGQLASTLTNGKIVIFYTGHVISVYSLISITFFFQLKF